MALARLKNHVVVRTVLAVQKRYKRDAADQLAAAIGFFGFLSLVPLLLIAVAVAGFVWQDPEEQTRVALALTQALPGFQETLGGSGEDTAVAALIDTVVRNRATFGLVGFATLLLTGLRVIGAAMAATRVVFRGDVVTGVLGWLRKLGSMVALGLMGLIAVAGASVAGFELEVIPRQITVAFAFLVTFLFDFLLFLMAYRVLSTTTSMRLRQLVPGAVLGAIGWSLLKVVGASYVGGQVDSANALYGALGGVIALLLLLYLAGRLYLYGAELSAVIVEARQGPLTASEEVSERENDQPMRQDDASVRDSGTLSGTLSGAQQSESHHFRTTAAFALAAAALALGWRLLGDPRDP